MQTARDLSRRRLMGVVAVLVAAAAASAAVVLFAAGPAMAATVHIHDASEVLDATRIQHEAATLPDPVEIYTTTRFADDQTAFGRETQSKVSAASMIVIAINTQSRHLAIRTGPESRIDNAAAQQATRSFVDSYRRADHDYTAATIAALDSMRKAIAKSSGRATPQQSHPQPSPAQSASSDIGPLDALLGGMCCLLFVAVIAGVVVSSIARARRRSAPGSGHRPGQVPPPGYGYGPPGYGPRPGYGRGHGPGAGYRRPGRPGVNPWLAGGAGAAAGGLLGYELGRLEGEHGETHESQGDSGSADFGGGADADFGDLGGDFGGSGSSDDF